MVLRLIEEGRPLDEIVFFDTGWEFPQMHDHIAKFEAFSGRTVTRLKPKLPFTEWMISRKIVARKGPMKGQVHRLGNGWPSPSRRWCTREKVDTIDRHCKNAARYIGYAADEANRTLSYGVKRARYECFYPLLEWDMDEAACLAYCRARGFDWGGLYDIFPRVSCFCCPLQRIGQLRNLRRHFPELWAQMLGWEKQIKRQKFGFKEWVTVADLDARFTQEDRQGTFPSMANAERQGRGLSAYPARSCSVEDRA